MDNAELNRAFRELTTPVIADASMRLGHRAQAGSPRITALIPGSRVAGRALPVRHFGSVDVFLEAATLADPGDLLVIDNQEREGTRFCRRSVVAAVGS